MKSILSLFTTLFLGVVCLPVSSNSQSTICGINSPIFDNSCTASSNFPITVSGTSGTQLGSDVILQEVRFIIAHTWDNDLDIKLISPSGISIELSTDNGGGADHYGDPSDNTCTNYTTLKMNACLPIESGVAPFIGQFIPEGDFKDFNDNSDPDGIWILQVCDDASNDVGALQFAELVFAEMSCPAVTNLSVDTLLGNAVAISWSPGSFCTNTVLEYGPPGFIPGTAASADEGTLLTLNCPVTQPYTINGLADLTSYEIYIRESCVNGGFSSNSCPLAITTNCNTPAITLLENFDTLMNCATTCGSVCPITGTWFNSASDDFDWLIDGGGTGSANTGPSDDISGGGNYIYTEASGSACRNGNEAVLESNCLLVDAVGGTCHLSFFYHLYGTHINELQLQISTDGGVNWVLLWNVIGNQGDSWERTYIDLSAYHNLLAKFRFISIGGNGIKGDMALDDITFFGTTLANGGGTTFYADLDNDSFGDANNTVTLCTQLIPSGYVTNSDDCDDTTNTVSPNATEIPCNVIDENCDGFLLQTLPALSAANQTICIGDSASLSVNGMANGDFYWSDNDGNILFVGDTFYTPVLTQNASYWVQDSVVNICTSPRKMISVFVDPGPSIGTNDQPIICLGDNLNLSSLNIIDANNNTNTISYHAGSPATSANELSSAIVTPIADSTFYLLASTVNGCTDELAVSIVVNNTPTVLISALNNDLNICANELTSISGAEGGTGLAPFTFLWEDGSTAPTRTILPISPPAPYSYELQITDANNCTGVDSIIINTLMSITGVSIISINDVSFCDGNNGAITLNPVDGQPPYQYDWSGPTAGSSSSGSGDFIITGLTQGAYRITVSDSSGGDCSVLLPNVIVNGPGVVVDTVITIQAVSCFGASDGSIDIEVSGGTPSFLWSDDSVTEDLQNVEAGIYAVTITEGGCETILSNLEITSPSAITVTIANAKNVSCNNGLDGQIDINVTGGSSPYSYGWSNNEITEDLSGLSQGDYQVTITDDKGCAVVASSINISAPAPLIAILNGVSEVDCYNGSNGALSFAASGGTMPYYYEWSNGLLTNTISDLTPGNYQVTITDANGCSAEGDEITLANPSSLLITLDTLNAPDCNEVLNGQIAISVAGGSAPYLYQWSNNEITEDLNNLPEGTYQLTLTDAKGCTLISEVYEIVAPEVLFFGLVFINEESCTGVSDGSIQTQIVGGTQPYTYEWSNGAQSSNIDNLPAGKYQLLVTDNNGCTRLSDSLEIVALEPLSASIEQFSHISCNGNTDGSIYLDLPMAGMPYSYLWNNGSTASFLEGIAAGSYQAQIIANDGCTFYSEEIIIEEPEVLEVAVASVEMPTCNGFFNGSIDVAISGGTTPYTYSWNNGNSEEDLTAAPSGTYLLTVIDQNGCAIQTTAIQLTEPDHIDLNLESTGVGCIDSTGTIGVILSGGTAPYQYLWNTGGTSAIINNLPAGQYNLTATDANGCLLLSSGLTIDQLVDTIEVNAILDSEVSCFGMSDANLSIEILGGNYPFQYNWSNGITDSLNQDLAGGNYSVTVTDNYGCVGISESIAVASPTDIEYYVDGIVGNFCLGDEQGAATILISGGTAPYIINWSNGADSTHISQLATGEYQVTITDQNNCTEVSTQPIVVTGPASSVQAEIVGSDDINCFGETNASITVIPSGGVGGYTFDWTTGSNEAVLDNLGSGFYQCTITDLNNCIFVTPIYEIEGPDIPLTTVSDSSMVWHNVDCNGLNGAIYLFAEGGTSPYDYLWNNNAITAEIDELSSGTYLCTITDANGCTTVSENFLITEPDNTLSINMNSTPDTNEMGDGTASPDITGGNWPFFFEWDQNTGFQMDSIATDLSSGFYTVTITDANNCTITSEVLVDTLTILSDAVITLEDLGSIAYHPNPTKDFLYLDIQLSEATDLTLRLSNLLGKPIREQHLSKVTTEQLNFDVRSLPAGIYVLWAQVGGKVLLREFIVIPRS